MHTQWKNALLQQHLVSGRRGTGGKTLCHAGMHQQLPFFWAVGCLQHWLFRKFFCGIVLAIRQIQMNTFYMSKIRADRENTRETENGRLTRRERKRKKCEKEKNEQRERDKRIMPNRCNWNSLLCFDPHRFFTFNPFYC